MVLSERIFAGLVERFYLLVFCALLFVVGVWNPRRAHEMMRHVVLEQLESIEITRRRS